MNDEYDTDKTANTADKKRSKEKTDDAKKDFLKDDAPKENYEGSMRQKTGDKDK